MVEAAPDRLHRLRQVVQVWPRNLLARESERGEAEAEPECDAAAKPWDPMCFSEESRARARRGKHAARARAERRPLIHSLVLDLVPQDRVALELSKATARSHHENAAGADHGPAYQAKGAGPGQRLVVEVDIHSWRPLLHE